MCGVRQVQSGRESGNEEDGAGRGGGAAVPEVALMAASLACL